MAPLHIPLELNPDPLLVPRKNIHRHTRPFYGVSFPPTN